MLVWVLATPCLAAAQSPPPATDGVERPAERSGAAGLVAVDYLLYVPRRVLEFFLLAGEGTSDLVENAQIVPRVREYAHGHGILVFPTLFAETGGTPSVGARMVAKGGGVSTSVRGGFGGVDQWAVESKIRYALRTPILPTAFAAEWMYDERTDLEYRGVGQVPELDSRNRFVGAPGTALYRQLRSRFIAGIGVRPVDDVEMFVSTSYTRYRIDDAPGSENRGLRQVFQPSELYGTFVPSGVVYGEAAVRLDTRATRRLPSPGKLLGVYAGTGTGVPDGPRVRFVRFGGRGAVFVPIPDRDAIVAPKLVVDVTAPVNHSEIPFSELTAQPEYRGFDTRRDFLSVVGSVDYRWPIARYVAARIFTDAATVAGAPTTITLSAPRFVVGFGLDFVSRSSEIARMGFAAGAEGIKLYLSIGGATDFGDNQHRD